MVTIFFPLSLSLSLSSFWERESWVGVGGWWGEKWIIERSEEAIRTICWERWMASIEFIDECYLPYLKLSRSAGDVMKEGDFFHAGRRARDVASASIRHLSSFSLSLLLSFFHAFSVSYFFSIFFCPYPPSSSIESFQSCVISGLALFNYQSKGNRLLSSAASLFDIMYRENDIHQLGNADSVSVLFVRVCWLALLVWLLENWQRSEMEERKLDPIPRSSLCVGGCVWGGGVGLMALVEPRILARFVWFVDLSILFECVRAASRSIQLLPSLQVSIKGKSRSEIDI